MFFSVCRSTNGQAIIAQFKIEQNLAELSLASHFLAKGTQLSNSYLYLKVDVIQNVLEIVTLLLERRC